MWSIGKLSILAVGLAAMLAIGAREISSACVPTNKPDAHGHGHGHGETEDGHAQEGFLVRACEDGVFVALKEQVGFGSATVPAKAETAEMKKEESASHDGHDHGGVVPFGVAGEEEVGFISGESVADGDAVECGVGDG